MLQWGAGFSRAPFCALERSAGQNLLLRRGQLLLYNKEQCKDHPVFVERKFPSCEFVFIPSAARST